MQQAGIADDRRRGVDCFDDADGGRESGAQHLH